jgi:hypothetical protein
MLGQTLLLFKVATAMALAQPDLRVGDTLSLTEMWANDTGEMGSSTSTELLQRIEISGDTTNFHFTLLTATAGNWTSLVITPMSVLNPLQETKLALLHGIPRNVLVGSSRLREVSWFLPESSSVVFFPETKPIAQVFTMPFLGSDQASYLQDGFTVRLTDSTGVRWIDSAGSGFQAYHVRFESATDSVGRSTFLYALTSTGAGPFCAINNPSIGYGFIGIGTRDFPLAWNPPQGPGAYSIRNPEVHHAVQDASIKASNVARTRSGIVARYSADGRLDGMRRNFGIGLVGRSERGADPIFTPEVGR